MASTAAGGAPSAADRLGAATRVWAAVEAWLDRERHNLVLWAPVALGCGIAAWFLLPTPGLWLAAGALFVALAAGGAALPGWFGRLLLIGGLLAATGVGLAWWRAEAVAAPRLVETRIAIRFEARVLRVEDRSGREQWRLFLAPDAAAALPPKVRVSLRAAPPEGVTAGARVALRATLRPPPGPSVPGGYDFARRAWFEGVGAIGYALGPVELRARAPPPVGVAAWLARARVTLTRRIHTLVGGPEGAIAAAFVTGDQGRIPQATAQTMRDSGLAHLLSISGLHIAVVVGGVMVATRRLLTLSPWVALHWPVKALAAALAAAAGIAYTLLAGAEVPTVRSVLAALVVLAGIMAGRDAISLRSVAFAAFVILLVRPEALLGPSFQLSFAAVTGLVALYASPAARRFAAPREDAGFLRRASVWAVGLVASGVVAQAMLAPVAFFHFNRDGLYGVFANLVAIPLTSLVLMPALGGLLLLDLVGLAAPAAWVVREGMGVLLHVAEVTAGWPGAVARAPTMPLAAFGLFALGGLWLCLWETRARLLGAVPVALGVALAVLARPPDLIVSGDGAHLGVAARDGSLALLRPRAGDFIRDMWGDAMGTAATLPLDEVASASCSPDACLVLVARNGRTWRVLATRSKRWIERGEFRAQCAAADIVVSDRRLPGWCRPGWLKLDRVALGRTGAVALWLDGPRVVTAAAGQGAHPWAVKPEPARRWRKRGSTPRRDGRAG